jgi:membrane protein
MIEKFRQAIKEFIDDDCPTLAAALAYYTIFSLPPLLFIIIVVAGFVVGRETVQAAIQRQVQGMLGGAASGQVSTMASSAGQTSGGGIFGLAISAVGVIFGATSAFARLQAALNRSWKIEVEAGGIGGFIVKRILSFLIVILIAALILASVVLNAWTASAGSIFVAPGWLIEAASFAVSFLLLFALFAVIFKYFPDAEVDWSDVKTGAFVTAALFEVGRFLLAMYLGRTATASMYGAAGSLALILLFLYYSSMLVLLGAEFTQVWARSAGKAVRPKRGAVPRHTVAWRDALDPSRRYT